jgi:uncharacterized membrane protein
VSRDEQGSTIPLILGFFLLALLTVAGSVALADAFVQQRDLQDICDGAAAAAAATAIDLDRAAGPGERPTATFADAARVEAVVAAYLARDPQRRTVSVHAEFDSTRTTLTLHCAQRRTIAFGVIFGNPSVTHAVRSTARVPLRD